ncbi:MAG: trypsin-like serine protease [Saprospiraceae bacterium]|nr:trypsin-like serine protease [Saprospiraceae bacterium]
MTWIYLLLWLIQPVGVIRHGIDKQRSIELAHQKEYQCVGLMRQHSRVRGSCVLIHPRIVLTAAHTLVKLTPNTPLMIQFDSLEIVVDSFLLHPWYQSRKEADLALIYLSDRVTSMEPAILNKDRTVTGLMSTSVGWGNFSIANDPGSIVDAGRFKSAGTNVLDSLVGNLLPDGQIPYLYADFDHPENPDFNRSGSALGTAMEFGLDGGDSGGGMFVHVNGKTMLTGINAIQNKNIADIIRTKSFYGSSSQWVRISVFRKWIKKEIKKFERRSAIADKSD